jgi:hypothetical protein
MLINICILISFLFNFNDALSLVERSLRVEHLHRDVHLNSEKIEFGEQVFYDLLDLEPSSYYEIRISYPATVKMFIIYYFIIFIILFILLVLFILFSSFRHQHRLIFDLLVIFLNLQQDIYQILKN